MDANEKATCTECVKNYYLDANGKCTQAGCKGDGFATNGKQCTRCAYKYKLVSGNEGCTDCVGDFSCPQDCTAVTGGGGGGGATGNGSNTTNTDSGSKLAFSLLILAFVAILGHMMI